MQFTNSLGHWAGAKSASWDGRDVRSPGYPRFEGRILPRKYDKGPRPEGLRTIPNGERPARSSRPVLAVAALAMFLLGIYVQANRYSECRATGEDAVTCFVTP